MIPIIITGAAGRMGKMLVASSLQSKLVKLVGATEHPQSPVMGQDAGLAAGAGKSGVIVSSSLKSVLESLSKKAVVIDFTQTESTLHHLQDALFHQTPMVIGTTGFNEASKNKIQEAAKKIPLVLSPNMSVGVNALFKLTAEAAEILGEGYDLEILEAHHRKKKDAPSGTAIRLAEILVKSTGRRYPQDVRFHREGMTGERSSKEIGMQVIRGGDIVGEHTVFYCGDGERLEIRHVATSRKTFAEGALRAAIWIADKKPGLYGMNDVLGIK